MYCLKCTIPKLKKPGIRIVDFKSESFMSHLPSKICLSTCKVNNVVLSASQILKQCTAKLCQNKFQFRYSPFTTSHNHRPSTVSLRSFLSGTFLSSWYQLLSIDLISASNPTSPRSFRVFRFIATLYERITVHYQVFRNFSRNPTYYFYHNQKS